MERARYEWLRELGFDIHSLIQVHKVIFMVRSLSIEYFKPALLDDLLHITAQAAELGRSRITISQHVLRGTTLLANATVQAVCVGAESLRPVSVPAPLRQKLGSSVMSPAVTQDMSLFPSHRQRQSAGAIGHGVVAADFLSVVVVHLSQAVRRSVRR